MTSENDPEVVRNVMARYFARMRDVAELHGGTVEKFVGDAVMVVFGVPRVHEDDAERAVRAALAMRDSVQQMGSVSGIGLTLRVGVNSGEAVAGPGDNAEFLVTGDVVNVAARLQQSAQPDEILVGAPTRRLTGPAIEYQDREPIVAKGKESPIAASRAVRALTHRHGSRARDHSSETELVGREPELALMIGTLARAIAERRPHLFTVVGDAGVGKSRLVREALAGLASREVVQRLHGQCLPYGRDIIYWPLIELIREDASISTADDSAAVRDKLAERLAAVIPEDGQRTSIQRCLAAVLGLASVNETMPGIAASGIAIELAAGVGGYLRGLASSKPLVVVIDDLQWAAPTLVEVIQHIAREVENVALVLVCIARSEFLDAHPAWATQRPSSTLLELRSLTSSETEHLLAELMRSSELGSPLRSRVIQRAAGNPLFCEEFARMLLDESAVGAGHKLSGDLPIPETVGALLAARIDSLGAEEKLALQAASVIGEYFTHQQLSALVSSDQLDEAIDSLVRRAFFLEHRFDSGNEGLRFKHILVRDATYASLPKAERLALHTRRGEALEMYAAARHRLAEFSELLAIHAESALSLALGLRRDTPEIERYRENAVRWRALATDRAVAIGLAQEQADKSSS